MSRSIEPRPLTFSNSAQIVWRSANGFGFVTAITIPSASTAIIPMPISLRLNMAASAPAVSPGSGYGSRARWQVSTGAKRSAGFPGAVWPTGIEFEVAETIPSPARRMSPAYGATVSTSCSQRPEQRLDRGDRRLQVAEHRGRRGEHRVDLPR